MRCMNVRELLDAWHRGEVHLGDSVEVTGWIVGNKYRNSQGETWSDVWVMAEAFGHLEQHRQDSIFIQGDVDVLFSGGVAFAPLGGRGLLYYWPVVISGGLAASTPPYPLAITNVTRLAIRDMHGEWHESSLKPWPKPKRCTEPRDPSEDEDLPTVYFDEP